MTPTSLLNHKLYPAHELAIAYHERWEIEITIDEADTHQCRPLRPFRSRTPIAVLQEFCGLLIAHYLIRSIMHEAVFKAEVAPDRLIFVIQFGLSVIQFSNLRLWPNRRLRNARNVC